MEIPEKNYNIETKRRNTLKQQGITSILYLDVKWNPYHVNPRFYGKTGMKLSGNISD
jgi:hypothetical protein